MSSDPKSGSVKLVDGSLEPCQFITYPSEIVSMDVLEDTDSVPKFRPSQTGWGKVFVNNLYILYVRVKEDGDGDSKDPQYMEVPHHICDKIFAKRTTDAIIAKNNVLSVKEVDGVEVKIPMVPSYIFATRRAQRKLNIEAIRWWSVKRKFLLEKARFANNKSRVFGLFCSDHPGYYGVEGAKQWFTSAIGNYEADIKANIDPKKRLENMLNPIEASKKRDVIAPVRERVLDAHVEKKKKEEAEKEKEQANTQSKEDNEDTTDDEEEEDSSSGEEEEEEEEKNTKKTVKTKTTSTKTTATAKKVAAVSDSESSSSSESEEEVKVSAKAKAKTTTTTSTNKNDAKNKKPVGKAAAAKTTSRVNYDDDSSDSESESESEEETQKKPAATVVDAKKAPAKRRMNFDSDSESDSESESEEEEVKPTKKAVKASSASTTTAKKAKK